ncbi:MAG: agmatinase, partial [Thermodesulfobacteria bacterium]|nr:agmatinase [Thermodesulfobacteriota bacterium]
MGCQFLGQDFATSFEDAGFVISPFPYDSTASYGSGARNGPARILEASTQLELFDEELESLPYKAGIHTFPIPEVPVEPEKAKGLARHLASNILEHGKIPVFLGGDHSITIGVIEAVAGHFQGDITLLQLDAHTDMRDTYQGTPLSHACVARRASELCPV